MKKEVLEEGAILLQAWACLRKRVYNKHDGRSRREAISSNIVRETCSFHRQVVRRIKE